MHYDKLKSSKSFAQLRRKGSSFVAPAFVILVQKTNQSDQIKIGFTTSKKIGNAVKRVLARRRLKAALNEIPSTKLQQFAGFEFNIIGRAKAIDVDFEKLTFYFKKTIENIEKEYLENAKKD